MVHLLEGQSVEVDRVAFVGVKGFAGGFGRFMLGSFGEPAVKAMVAESVTEAMHLENALRKVSSDRTLTILHYAPISDTVAGEPPEISTFLGSSGLAETIDRLPVSAVVHGHAHRGAYGAAPPPECASTTLRSKSKSRAGSLTPSWNIEAALVLHN